MPLAPAAEPAPSTDTPWEWPWYRWRKGEGWTFLWIVAIHVLAVAGLLVSPVPSAEVLLVALALTWLGGLGTTVVYHRALAHRSLRLSRPVEAFLTFFGLLNGSGAPSTWIANHRLHHAKSDGPGDISSPGLGGFWWAHLRWLWQAEQAPIARWAPEMETRYYRFWKRSQLVLSLLTLLMGAPFGLAAFVWLGPVRLVFCLHAQCFVNSIAHMREHARPGEDSSQNIAWLGVIHLFQGENWHANHHADPADPRLGRTPMQWDAGWWTIVTLEKLGLASKVRRRERQRAPGSGIAG